MWILLTSAILLVSVGVVLFLRKMNNCVVIARNTTYIHAILSSEFKDSFPSEDVLLATCGVIDVA